MFKYIFLQQRDNSCHITSFANYSILQKLREEASKSGNQIIDLAKQSDLWQSRYEQLPIISKQLLEWQEAIKQAFKDRKILDTLEHEKKHGIHCGEHYYENGAKYSGSYNPFSGNFTLNVFDKNFKLLYTPHTIIDIKKMGLEGELLAKESALTTLPIFYNKEQIKIYNPFNEKYEAIENPILNLSEEQKNDNGIIKLKLSDNRTIGISISDELREYYRLPKDENICLEGERDILGQEMAFKHLYLPKEFLSYTKYLSSLYDLILFNLGVNRDGSTIDNTSPKYAELDKLKKCMQENPDNPWSLDAFNKENFIEYKIAEVLKNNPKLKEQLKKHINFSGFYHPHKYFDDLSKLYTSNDAKTRLEISNLIGTYIPNEELMLAYHLMSLNVTLWAAAKSHNAYMAVQELDQVPGLTNLFKLYGMPGANQFIKSAYKKSDDDITFVDVWLKIKRELAAKNPNKNDYVCFCDHGRIISFADDLRYMQEQHTADHPEILQELGFALIDSYYPEQLSPFYRQDEKTLHSKSLKMTSDGKLAEGAVFHKYNAYVYKNDMQKILDYLYDLHNKIMQLIFSLSSNVELTPSLKRANKNY